MYYVPGLYFSDTEGLDPAYVKPTIGPDGAIVHWFAALSHDGTDLPERQGDYELDWVRAGETPWDGVDVFTETEAEGIPVLTSRQMYARKGQPPQEEQSPPQEADGSKSAVSGFSPSADCEMMALIRCSSSSRADFALS